MVRASAWPDMARLVPLAGVEDEDELEGRCDVDSPLALLSMCVGLLAVLDTDRTNVPRSKLRQPINANMASSCVIYNAQ